MRIVVYCILAVTFLIASTGSAQPLLTFDNTGPMVGASYEVLVGGPMDPGAAGPDQVWDYSGFVVSDTISFSYVQSDMDSINGCPLDYPHDIVGGGYVAPVDHAFVMRNLYIIYPMGNLPFYTENHRVLEYPIAYGQAFDNMRLYKFNFSDCGIYLVQSPEHIEADAYGTLILPFGTFGPVLRVHHTGSGFESTEVDEEGYRFYLPGTHYPLVTIAKGFPSALDTTWTMRMLDPASIVGLREEPSVGAGITFRPQPANDVLFVDVPPDLHDASGVEVLDMSARRVQGYAPTELRAGLDVSDLSAGVYMLRISDRGGAVLTGRFIKR